MLVLTRELKQAVIIRLGGQECRVVLLRTGNGEARLGFEAGDDVLILREELATIPQHKVDEVAGTNAS